MSDIKEFFMQIPVITRYWFGFSILLPILGRITPINPYYMFLTSDFLGKFEVLYKIKLHFHLNNFFKDLETIYCNVLLSDRPGYWVSLSS